MSIKKADLGPGDEVEVTVKGKIVRVNAEHACTTVLDERGWQHWIFMGSTTGAGVKKMAPAFQPKAGEVYKVGDTGIWLCVSKSSVSAVEAVMISMVNITLRVK